MTLSYQTAVGGYSVSYFRPISKNLWKSSGVGGGGGEERSLPGTPASSKNPSNPAGAMNSNVLAGFDVAFLQACSVPLGMWKTDPGFAVKVRLPSRTLCSPFIHRESERRSSRKPRVAKA